MANDRQFKTRTKYVATRGVDEYRRTIPALVRSDDVVLELGCEWGMTTKLLASAADVVIGTDVSDACVERARKIHPFLRFEVLDAFDVRAALDLAEDCSVVYLDLSGFSGYRSLLDVIALIQMYAVVLRPRLIVVKSGALKHFAASCVPWQDRRSPSA
jgi:hypothetical protein